MYSNLKSSYDKNLVGIKKIASQLGLSTLSPKKKLQNRIKDLKDSIWRLENYDPDVLIAARKKMDVIKGWQAFRSLEKKQIEIRDQQAKINNIIEKHKRSIINKKHKIRSLEDDLSELK